MTSLARRKMVRARVQSRNATRTISKTYAADRRTDNAVPLQQKRVKMRTKAKKVRVLVIMTSFGLLHLVVPALRRETPRI